MEIISLKEAPELLGTITEWHRNEWWDEWADFMKACNYNWWIPTLFIGHIDGKPIGTSLLMEEDMTTRKDLTPWLAGVYVIPEERRKWYGTTLARHAMIQAKALWVQKLWLYTHTARHIYETLWWKYVSSEEYGDEWNVDIMNYTF
jgi:GNAT superfamily N-acetyltransferase